MSLGSILGNNAQQGALGQWSAAQAQADIFNAQAKIASDNDLVGVFKILRAEDGFIVRCAPGEGYKQKTFVASDIDEAMDKAKAFLVIEAMEK